MFTRPKIKTPKLVKLAAVNLSKRGKKIRWRIAKTRSFRAGVSSMDLVLLLAVILPLVAFLFAIVPRMIQLVYEMAVMIIGMPFM